MLNEYWPDEKQVLSCMHTEAEVAAEHLLLAVHEPMRLSHRSKDAVDGEAKSEHDLLEDLLTQSYPIPIVGAPGTGKSHLVCWLDAKLKTTEGCDDWHIIRIPKAASFRQVLELLLDGLDDKDLDETRAKINKIGQELKVDQVANRLISDIKVALDDLFEKEDVQLKKLYDTNPELVNPEQKSRHAFLKLHAGYDGLDALIGDSTFKQRLVGKDKCLYRIAKQFTQGKKRKEEDDETKISMIVQSDLSMQASDIHSFSSTAIKYITSAQLMSPQKQSEVVELLNQLLTEALHKTALHLYQVDGFSDLFMHIRRYLKSKNRTLALLIEDLSAISAIKDELLDNLLVNSTHKGHEDLCTIRSVFAVTTSAEGYKAYQGKRDTILSRLGNKEWNIDESSSDDEDTIGRIENLCGRYLNAARIGHDNLKSSFEMHHEESEWPKIWCSDVEDDNEIIKTFGASPNGHPLFPFNKHALRALANAYCYRGGKLQFVPRDIIIFILKDVLKNYRQEFINKKFPTKKFFNALPKLQGIQSAEISSTLQGELNAIENNDRITTLVKIWGYQTPNINELAQAMPHSVARLFGEEQLANMLVNVGAGTALPVPAIPRPIVNPSPGKDHSKSLPQSVTQLQQIPKEIDKWFADEVIPQADAQKIRKVLSTNLVAVLANDYEKWVAVKGLREGFSAIRIPIHVAFNINNIPNCILFFGNKPQNPGSDYGNYGNSQNQFRYKKFLIAFKRYQLHDEKWDYSDAFEDYCYYHNFVDDWVVESIKVLVARSRDEVKSLEIIQEQLRNALLFDPSIKNFEQQLRFVCHRYQSVGDGKKFFPPPGINSFLATTPYPDWNEKLTFIADGWDKSRKKILDLYTPGNAYAIEGDLLIPIFKGVIDPQVPFSKSISRLAKNGQDHLKNTYEVMEWLEGCSNESELVSTLTDMDGLLKELSNAGVYPHEQPLTSRQISNSVDSFLKDNPWPTTKALMHIMGPFEATKIVTNLNRVDKVKAEALLKILSVWKSVYPSVSSHLRHKNQASGNENTAVKKQQVNIYISNIESQLANLGAISND